MVLIDTHTHLYLEEFKNDLNETIRRSQNSNVKYYIIPNIDSSSITQVSDLCKSYPDFCFPSIGLHPCYVKQDFKNHIAIIEEHLKTEKFVAIGETGIDLYWDKTTFSEQFDAFKMQLLLAKKYKLPVIIHSRNSMEEIINVITNEDYNRIKGVFHCFSGNLEQAQFLVDKGFMLGISGVVTYKNSGLVKIVKEIPLKHLLLETDAPFLPPVPYRGQRNESAYIAIIANFIANIKECAIEEVASVTTGNAIELFNIDVKVE